MNWVLRVFGLTIVVALLGGCASVATPSDSSPLPSSSADAIDASTLALEFQKIAASSCDRAYDEGVTERVDGIANRLVLLPVSYLYNDFFAAVVNDEGGVEPIWSTEIFSACADHINFLMAEESNSEYEIQVSGDLAGGKLRAEYQGGDYGTIVTDYVVVDGFFVEVTTNSAEAKQATVLKYGTPSEADIESFREAIDLFLSNE
jgi:hypothetical protein